MKLPEKSTLVLLFIAITSVVGVMLSRTNLPEYSIRIGFLGSPEDEDYVGSLAFKQKVEALTDGRVRVDIYSSGQFCGNERECLDGLSSGVLDIHMTTVGGAGRLMPALQALDLPYLLPNDEVAECVLDGGIVDLINQTASEQNLGMRLVVIGNTGGWRHIATKDRLIKRPADLKGLKIRATPSALQQELLRAFGANPTPIAWSELYSALATGVVDGTMNSLQDIVSTRLHEHVKFITMDGHSYMAALWWFSEQRWQALPADVRDAVLEGFKDLKQATRAMPKRSEAAAIESFESAGGQLYRPDAAERAVFRQAAAPLRQWFIEGQGAAWVERLERDVARCEGQTQSPG